MKKESFLLMFVLIGSFIACTNGGILKVEKKKYTPISLYYNPLELVPDWLNPCMVSPDFLNYPDDLSKFGLRGKVKSVIYDPLFRELEFNEQGNLMLSAGYLGKNRNYGDVYIYDYSPEKKLTQMRNARNARKQTYSYDESGKLVKREGALGYGYQTYNYYVDGKMKEIVNHPYSDNLYLHGTYGEMKCNENGDIVYLEMYKSNNPFFSDRLRLRSVSTFGYASNGLCSDKTETLYWGKSDCDSIRCYNTYEYNEKGDIILWHYKDEWYSKTKTENSITCGLAYKYIYDANNNWTQMTITIPKVFSESDSAREVLSFMIRSQSVFGLVSQNGEGNYIITYKRNINYYSESDADVAKN